MGKQLLLVVSCLFLFLLIPFMSYSASWQETLDSQFDIVETFDDLEDWKGIATGGSIYNQDYMPDKIDGTDSMWNVYDNYHTSVGDGNWIQNHGTNNVWRGVGKSLKMDLNQDKNVPLNGAQRFGLYFGSNTVDVADAYTQSGLKNSGYDDVYYFYMIKFPSNAFPTDNGSEWPDGTYKYFSYYKFNVMATGFTDVVTMSEGGRDPYGRGNSNHNWKFCSGYCGPNALNSISLKLNWYISDADGNTIEQTAGDWTTGGSINQYMRDDRWFGMEIRQKKNTNGNSDGALTVWLYDDQGTATQIYDNQSIKLVGDGLDHNFNKFFFGGNLSFQNDVDSQGLDTTYYVDDFIMDDQRIGPKYFELINSGTSPVNIEIIGDVIIE